MARVQIYEWPSICWPNAFYRDSAIDRSGVSVENYLNDLGIDWIQEYKLAEFIIRKAELSKASLSDLDGEQSARDSLNTCRSLFLIGEPFELAPASYLISDSSNTLAVAPEPGLDRLYFCSEWADPQLENWQKRDDRFVWIARPLPERIRLAEQLERLQIPLDIFSREAWPVQSWRGEAPDDIDFARRYRYRLVFENSKTHGYHSEKLFRSVLSGCVTFYLGDPALHLPWIKNISAPLTEEALIHRHDYSKVLLENMSQFMFSSAWEVYSPREFYHRILRNLGLKN